MNKKGSSKGLINGFIFYFFICRKALQNTKINWESIIAGTDRNEEIDKNKKNSHIA